MDYLRNIAGYKMGQLRVMMRFGIVTDKKGSFDCSRKWPKEMLMVSWHQKLSQKLFSGREAQADIVF